MHMKHEFTKEVIKTSARPIIRKPFHPAMVSTWPACWFLCLLIPTHWHVVVAVFFVASLRIIIARRGLFITRYAPSGSIFVIVRNALHRKFLGWKTDVSWIPFIIRKSFV